MKEKQETPQTHAKNSTEDRAETAVSPGNSEKQPENPSQVRPREGIEAERKIGREKKRYGRQTSRDTARSRGINRDTQRPKASDSAKIQQQKRTIAERIAASAAVKTSQTPVGFAEDRAIVKWAAWAALAISLLTSFLLGLYSSKDFSPAFEYYDLEMTQKQLKNDVNKLKYSTLAEKIETAVIHAQFQLMVRKDYDMAEAILDDAKEDLKQFIDLLPIEQTVEPRQILSNIERVIRDIRRGPSTIDGRLNDISEMLADIQQSR